MKKNIVIFLLIILASCNQTQKPENLLSKEEMIDVLYELSLYQSIKNYNYNMDTLVLNGSVNDLLAKHGLDSLSFIEQSNYYMQEDMLKYSEMYEEVAKRLKNKVETMKKEKKVERKSHFLKDLINDKSDNKNTEHEDLD